MEKEFIDKGRDLFYNFYHENYFDLIKKVLLIEKFMYSLKYEFAGTTDSTYLNYSDRIVITDFKSASRERGGDTVHKFELQGAAYTIAFEELFKKAVDHVEIWISNPDGTQKLECGGALLGERKVEFLDYCASYHKMWEKDKIEELYLAAHIN